MAGLNIRGTVLVSGLTAGAVITGTMVAAQALNLLDLPSWQLTIGLWMPLGLLAIAAAITLTGIGIGALVDLAGARAARTAAQILEDEAEAAHEADTAAQAAQLIAD